MRRLPFWLICFIAAVVLVACGLPLQRIGDIITPATPTICPQATPERDPQVEPLPAQTDETSLIIRVSGRFEHYTITSEAGVVESDSGEITVPLLPNTLHHFTVTGRVPISVRWGCSYGGYSLSTMKDVDGSPLEVRQGQAP